MRKHIRQILTLVMIGLVSACGDESEDLAPIAINFTTTTLAVSGAEQPVVVPIALSRPVSQETTVSLQVDHGTLTYGEEADYYTVPPIVNGALALTVSAGAQDLSFEVHQGAGLNIQQDQAITLTLNPSSAELVVGANAIATVSFSENFIAQSGTVELNAGGEDFSAQAFFDLSKMTQTNVSKTNWDLGFASSEGAFAVVLNSVAYHMARPLDATDLTNVTADDTLGFAAQMVIPQFDPTVGAIDWVDDPTGNLSNTAFGEIAISEGDAKVFIVRREAQAWQKVKVHRDGDSYVVQYAAIDSPDFSTITIDKDPEYNFGFLSFEDGQVFAEPKKEAWDIMYSSFTEALSLGGPGMVIPYGFKDIITLNRHQTSTAMVLIEDIAYEDITLAQAANLTFSSEVNTIGANWRMGGGPNSGPQLFGDRFFVIKDAQGLHYKLRFTRLTGVNGERGLPEFKFEKL